MISKTQKLRVLIVDDSSDDTDRYRRLLLASSESEFDFFEGRTGEEILNRCRSEELDCIFLDDDLPDMTGQEFLKRLGRGKSEIPIPVIMLTDQGNEAVAVAAMKWGACDYLIKEQLTKESLYRALRNALEKTALQRQLVEKQQELEAFSHTAAHDLQAPLRIMMSFCSLMQRRCEGKFDEKIDQYMSCIMASGESMSRLIQKLLEYVRAGRANTSFEAVDLAFVVREAVAKLQADTAEAGAEIEIGELPVVHGDKTRLEQLLENLISNAIKFRGENAPRVSITSVCRDDRWEITVKDNGIGIDPADQEKVFTPFKRLHTESEYSGSGIGLATCKKIVDRHGGTMTLSSVPGEGTGITFALRKSDSSQPPLPV